MYQPYSYRQQINEPGTPSDGPPGLGENADELLEPDVGGVGFGQDQQTPPPSEPESRHNSLDRWHDRASRSRDNLARYRDKLKNRTAQNAAKSTAKTVGKEAVKQTGGAALRTGATVGAEAVTASTGVGLIVTAGIVILDVTIRALEALRSAKVRWALLYINLFFLFVVMLLFSLAAGYQAQTNHDGPDPRGGRAYRGTDDPYNYAVAASEPGIVAANSVEALDMAVKNARELLKKKPNSGAEAVLTEIQHLQNDLKSGAYAKDSSEMRTLTKRYSQLVEKLYSALYPGRKTAQAKVLPLVGNKISFTSVCKAKDIESDIRKLRLDENTYNVLFLVASQRSIQVNCLVSNHRKYVGLSPQQGHPVCGSSVTRANRSISAHCLGLGIDFQPDAGLYDYLVKNKSALRLRQVIHEGDHIHVTVHPSVRK